MNTVVGITSRTELIKTVTAAGTPERLTARSITAIERIAGAVIGGTSVGGLKCLVTCPGHGYCDGAVAYMSGANEEEFNTPDGVVVSVVDADSFHVMLEGDEASATGTLVCYADIWIRQATLLGKKTAVTLNTSNVRIGTLAAVNKQPYVIPPDGEAFLPAGREAVGPKINLGEWYVDAATNGDGVYVLYF